MQDEEFIAQFQAGTLASFPHRDHVKMAWLYLRRAPVLEAVTKFTADLQGFAAAKGQPNLYHETITWAYLLIIYERIQRQPDVSWDEFAAHNADLLTWQGGILQRFYRAETLASDDARRFFHWPDQLVTN